jgi:predicted permease
MSHTDFLTACKQLLVIGIHILGFAGMFLILYGIMTETDSKSKWVVLEDFVESISVYATLVGTLLTAGSIYFPENTRPPYPVSLIFVAPSIIIAVCITLYFALIKSSRIPPHVINGFSLLAMSGSLFRLLNR